MCCRTMSRGKTVIFKTRQTQQAYNLLIFLYSMIGASSLPHDKPFLSIWGAPTETCNKFGLNLSYFDFVINEHAAFKGNSSMLFYKFGRFPHYNGGIAVDGGLPQLGNVTMNNENVRKLVETSIPNKDFNGLAVFDWEGWVPIFRWNEGRNKIYQDKSLALVQKDHPNWNRTQIYQEAVKEFEYGAKQFMGGTVNLSRSMRPKGYWGYYEYPRCHDFINNGTQCDSNSMKNNDKLAYLFAGSTGYFPRIYLYGDVLSDPWVTAGLKESLRLRELYGAPWAEIMPYSAYIMGPLQKYYTEHDLDITVKQSADSGAGGIVFWGSSGNAQTPKQCLELMNYVDTILGPYIKLLTNFVEKCSFRLCSNHGRCVVPDIATINYRALKKRNENDYTGYICQCYYGWSGVRCEKPMKHRDKS